MTSSDPLTVKSLRPLQRGTACYIATCKPQTHKQAASDLRGFSLLVHRAVNLLPRGRIWQLPKVPMKYSFQSEILNQINLKQTWSGSRYSPPTPCLRAVVGYTSLPGFFESSGAGYFFPSIKQWFKACILPVLKLCQGITTLSSPKSTQKSTRALHPPWLWIIR